MPSPYLQLEIVSGQSVPMLSRISGGYLSYFERRLSELDAPY